MCLDVLDNNKVTGTDPKQKEGCFCPDGVENFGQVHVECTCTCGLHVRF